MLAGIPVLLSMFEFTDPEEPPVFQLPDSKELRKNGLALL